MHDTTNYTKFLIQQGTVLERCSNFMMLIKIYYYYILHSSNCSTILSLISFKISMTLVKSVIWSGIVDIELLKITLEKSFNEVKVNQYKEEDTSVFIIVKDAISEIDDFSYKIINESKVLFYYKSTEVGGINGQNILTNKREGSLIARDKMKTEKYLSDAGIKTTQSMRFNLNQIQDAEKEMANRRSPFVLKPYNLSSGRGVSLNVDFNNLSKSWKKSVDAYGDDYKEASLILQPQLPGIEARFLVVNGKFSSAILRAPANVVGDGKSSIEDLIRDKNYLRRKNPHLKKFMIHIDEELTDKLAEDNLELSTILPPYKLVFFTNVSNIALGGDTLEISHLVSGDMKKLAEEAIKSIPDLKSGGVDIMFSSFEDSEATVLEINHAANLIMHYYPWKGHPGQPIHDYVNDLYDEVHNQNTFGKRIVRNLRKVFNKK